MSDDFESLIERRRENESRIHVDLTDSFRERVTQILEPVGYTNQRDAFYNMFEKVGYSPLKDAISPSSSRSRDVLDVVHQSGTKAQNRLIFQGECIFVLSYLEWLLKEIHHERNAEMAERIVAKKFNTHLNPKVSFGN